MEIKVTLFQVIEANNAPTSAVATRWIIEKFFNPAIKEVKSNWKLETIIS